MMHKEKDIKTKRKKNTCELSRYEKVAFVTGKSPDVVRSYLKGYRNQDTALGTQICVADTLIEEGENKLLQSVRNLLKF